jgi:transcriptional regulator with XRE-family HTH domain
MDEIGKEIRRLREARGWGQTKLAAAADMAVSGVSQIENGHRNPNSATLIKLAQALEVEVADLFPKAQPPLPLEPGLTDFEAWVREEDSIPELRRAANDLNERWRELAAYERVTGLSSIEYERDIRHLAEIEHRLGIIQKRIEELDPPLCWITYRLDRPPEVQFHHPPTEEEETELREKLGDYKVVKNPTDTLRRTA